MNPSFSAEWFYVFMTKGLFCDTDTYAVLLVDCERLNSVALEVRRDALSSNVALLLEELSNSSSTLLRDARVDLSVTSLSISIAYERNLCLWVTIEVSSDLLDLNSLIVRDDSLVLLEEDVANHWLWFWSRVIALVLAFINILATSSALRMLAMILALVDSLAASTALCYWNWLWLWLANSLSVTVAKLASKTNETIEVPVSIVSML